MVVGGGDGKLGRLYSETKAEADTDKQNSPQKYEDQEAMSLVRCCSISITNSVRPPLIILEMK